ncbi:NmrA family NAD(P)-binding protein [Amycolatopsis sp. NPDC101161]|uniref:NmrA family NAD(P)-binding protein n=1 Tax=Amycolatopsis sp. NPDC101161 TaxID=3363940 RepID=UPI00382F44A9
MSRFLVTAAAGKTGSATIDHLLARGHRVRAMVRRDDERSRALAAAGAEVVHGDLLDLNAVTAALDGVTGAYFCYPIREGLLDATVNFAQAATETGVRSIVGMSQISARREARSNAARQHWLAERVLDRTGLLATHLRPTFFAEWLTTWWELRDGEGLLRLPFGDGRHAPIAAVDQGRVIAAVLADPEPHAGAAYTLHGPVELNHHEIAETMARTLGIPVRYEPITVEEFTASMTARGLPAHLIQHLGNVAIDYRNGVFADTNDVVEQVGGQTPLSVEQFVLANKESFAGNGPYFVS